MSFHAVIAGIWIAFLGYWLIAAFSAKRNRAGGGARRVARVIFVIVMYFMFRARGFGLGAPQTIPSEYAAVRVFGVILCAAGAAFAIWARVTLGKYWGMPMSVKEEPGLITTGPYAIVRHPIYSGEFFCALGSALATETWWFGVLAASIVYFVYSARQEEKLKLVEFPADYAAYRQRTKMLIPFLF